MDSETFRSSARAPAVTVSWETWRMGSAMVGFFVNAQAGGQGDEAEQQDYAKQGECRAPDFGAHRRIEGILGEDEDVIRQAEHGAFFDAVRDGGPGKDGRRKHDGGGLARCARKAQQ